MKVLFLFRPFIFSSLITLTLLLLPRNIFADEAEPRMYWSENGSSLLMSSDLSGGDQRILVPNAHNVNDIFVDSVTGEVYWSTPFGRILKSNSQGTSVEILVNTETGRNSTDGMEVDFPGGMIYWTDRLRDGIYRAKLDGSNIQAIVTNSVPNPRGLVLDTLNGKVYWSDTDNGTISRANLDGSNRQDIISAANVVYIAVDPIGAKIYWSDPDNNEIKRANLDGSNIETSVPFVSQPRGLSIDPLLGKIYFADQNGPRITRANLDGTNQASLLFFGLEQPRALHFNPVSRMVYWHDAGTRSIQHMNSNGSDIQEILGLSPLRGLDFQMAVHEKNSKIYLVPRGNGRGIYRMSLDGTDLEVLLDSELEGVPLGLALDEINEKIYWTETQPDRVRRADLDGKNIEDVTQLSQSTYAIAVDGVHGKLFVTTNSSILSYNLDGSGEETLTTRPEFPGHLALDIENQRVYWTQIEPDFPGSEIGRINMDGTGLKQVDILSGDAHQLYVDQRNGFVYYIVAQQNSGIRRTDLDLKINPADGSGFETLVEGLANPRGFTMALDRCPQDDSKFEPGVCGCDFPDNDSDSDGSFDCVDECPLDPAKNLTGICGCGIPEIDSDKDGVLDCTDQCPLDSEKQESGICGCGVPDLDSNQNSIFDCQELDFTSFVPGAPVLTVSGRIVSVAINEMTGATKYSCKVIKKYRNKRGRRRKKSIELTSSSPAITFRAKLKSLVIVRCSASNGFTETDLSPAVRKRIRRLKE